MHMTRNTIAHPGMGRDFKSGQNRITFSIAAYMTRLVRAFTEHARQQRDYRQLLEMSDYQLKDIGITRAEVIAKQRGRL